MPLPQSDRKVNYPDEPVKRPKVAQACEECRSRKVRCDGVQPVCGSCRRHHRTPRNCVWQSDRLVPGYSAEYVSQLEETIRRLESSQGNGAHLAEPAPFSAQYLDPPAGLASELQYADRSRLEADVASPASSQPFHKDSGKSMHSPMLERHESVDGMGNIVLNDTIHGGETSSAASFMRTVKDAVAARLSLNGRETPMPILPGAGTWIEAKIGRSHRLAAELFVLPPRRSSDEMINVYWSQIHVLYPFLHRSSFMESYHALWTSDSQGQVDRSFYCILNLLFALGCQITRSGSPDEKEKSAAIFFARARELLQTDLIGGGSFAMVEALLFMGLYLQSTEWPHRCWVVVGMAIRTAQGLGLNLAKTSANLKTQQDTEMTRRIWHGCVFMDRMVSMTLGRPMMINKVDADAVPLPSSIDDEYLSPEPNVYHRQPADMPPIMEFYVQSLELFRITADTLTALYHVDRRDDCSGQERPPIEKLESLDFNTILRIDTTLRQWNAALPDFLRPPARPQPDSNFTLLRQANILELRYRQTQILLFRPILSLLLTPELRAHDSTLKADQLHLSQAMALPCAHLCVSAALAAIDVIYSNQPDNVLSPHPYEPLPAWWYQVFFIYTAATALIPARVFGHIRGNVSLDSLTEGWRRSVVVLENLSPQSNSAKRCLAALQLLSGESSVVENGHASAAAHKDTSTRSMSPSKLDYQPVPPSFPAMADPTLPVDDYLPDFSWLDSLPADLLSADYTNLPDFGEF